MATLDGPTGKKWYDGNPTEIVGLVHRLERVLSSERFLDGAIVRAYHGRPMIPAGPMSTSASTVLPRASLYVAGLEALAQENLLRSAIDTACSQIVRAPAYKFVTTEGYWSQQVSARKLSRLLTALSHSAGVEDEANPIMVDCMTCMCGFGMWVINEDEPIRFERVLPHRVVWNPAEGPSPRTLGVRDAIPRSTLRMRFEGKEVNDHLISKRDIDELPIYRPTPEFFLDHPWSYLPESDMVEVCYAWRKSSGDDVGHYTMVSGHVVLADEEYDVPVWPIVPLRWSESYDTFAGVPGARQALAAQMRVNRMNRAIDEAQSKLCVPKVGIPIGSPVSWKTNAIAEFFEFNPALGTPIVVTPGAVLPAEFYNEAQRVRASVFELFGVSQAVAQGNKEAGLNSGIAQRERRAVAEGRLLLHAMRLERWYADVARVGLILLARQRGLGKVTWRDLSPLAKEVDWERLHAERDEIEIRAYITSAIPTEPAGRAETVEEWVQQGVITRSRALRLQADPDTARIEDQESAVEDLVLKMIDKAIVDGDEVSPDPLMGSDGLQLLADLGAKELCKAMVMPEPPPDSHMELLRRLVETAKDMATPPQPAAPAGGPPMPPGAGAQPPQMPAMAPLGPPQPVLQ
jgi:hypothetical protein